jgi:hypothetical protein
MSHPYWIFDNTNPRQRKTYVLQIQPTRMYWAARSPGRLAGVVETVSAGGLAPETDGKTLDRSAVRAVDYQQHAAWVRVRDATGTPHAVFTAETDGEAAEVAKTLAATLNLPLPPHESPATVWAVAKVPAALAGLSLIMGGCMYMAAVSPATSDGERHGRARAVSAAVDALGAGGILGLTALAVAACAVLWWYGLTHRPVVYSYGEPMPAKS